LAGSGLVAYASESATGYIYDIAFTFHGTGSPSPHLDMPGLGQGFKGFRFRVKTGKRIKVKG
jgi:hypothetical protein